MRRLMLLRHAKSPIGEPSQADRDRGLSRRGVNDARTMAAELAARGPLPDRILCSSARRSRETLAALLPELDGATDITITEALYEAAPDSYAGLIGAQAGDVEVLLMIGHNPAVHALAVALAGAGPGDLRAQMSSRFPAGTLAIIDFPDGPWRASDAGSGTLVAFVRPRDIAVARAG